MKSSERSVSIWEATRPQEEFTPLKEDVTADVCVVGAGIAGMSVAYFLARAGRRVVVIEDKAVGAGETGQTTAHLSSAMDETFIALEKLHGPDGARIAYESHQAAIDEIGRIAEREGIDCDYVRLDGYLFLDPGQSDDILERELEAARRAGFAGVELVEDPDLGAFRPGRSLRFPNQARFHPLKYLSGLARAVHRSGGHVFTGSRASEISGGSNAHVKTEDGHTVSASAVVVATNSPVNDLFVVHTKQEPYRTYAIAAGVAEDAIADALYWDTADPYHYVRLQADVDSGSPSRLIVGGEDHRTGDEPQGDPHARLEDWARGRFPIERVEHRWSGQVLEPVDGVAFIGRNPGDADNVYVVTGDSGQGMTHGTIAGMLISDLIQGIDNEWSRLYDPSRITLHPGSVKDFMRAGLNVVANYAERVLGTPGEVDSADEVPAGQGAIMRRGTDPIAIYRSPDGEVSELSAACTHLGCTVHWNDMEKSWDCPCHGSRFALDGQVLTGPAGSPLPPAEDKDA
jgi:glycine/D-amino acid oxidase-like deaminating enzyme/nitrite reductase/ring-hydroxylating ferredoxin subunit